MLFLGRRVAVPILSDGGGCLRSSMFMLMSQSPSIDGTWSAVAHGGGAYDWVLPGGAHPCVQVSPDLCSTVGLCVLCAAAVQPCSSYSYST